MNTSADSEAMDQNDTGLLPELSFDDLIDTTPAKGRRGKADLSDSNDSDPLDLDEDTDNTDDDDFLNTPKVKKYQTPHQYQYQHKPQQQQQQRQVSEQAAQHAQPRQQQSEHPSESQQQQIQQQSRQQPQQQQQHQQCKVDKPATSATTTTTTTAAATTTNKPILLNGKNILPKTAGNQFIKIAPRLTTTTTASSSSSATSTMATLSASGAVNIAKAGSAMTATTIASAAAAAAGKPTAKNSGGGQVIYIQKSMAGNMPAAKIVVQRAYGKQFVVTNPNLIKLSPKPSASPASTTITTEDGKSFKVTKISAPAPSGTSAAPSAAASKPDNTTTTTTTTTVQVKTAATVGSGSRVASTPDTASTPATATTITTTAATSAATAGATTATTPTQPKTTSILPVTTAKGGKIVVNGKQFVVSANQKLIKLSPKPLGGAGTTGLASATPGQQQHPLQTLQLPGKSIQYVQNAKGKQIVMTNVRVIPNPKLNIAAASGTAAGSTPATVSATTASGAMVSRASGSATATTATTATAGASSAATTPTTTSVKLLNALSHKFTVTLSPVNAQKLAKSMVKLPTVRSIGESNKGTAVSNTNPGTSVGSAPSTSATSAAASTTMVTSTGATTTSATAVAIANQSSLIRSSQSSANEAAANLMRKRKITEINTELQRITSTGGSDETLPEIKKTASGNRIVVMSRSMLRSNISAGGVAKSSSSSSSATGAIAQARAGLVQRLPVLGTHSSSKTTTTTSTTSGAPQVGQSPKKLYSVLKSNNADQQSTARPSKAEIKSLIICGQAQALLSQQKQQKGLQFKNHVSQQPQHAPKLPQDPAAAAAATATASSSSSSSSGRVAASNTTNSSTGKFIPIQIKEEPLDANDLEMKIKGGITRRKHCNCSKSQCLKLYCDCFANGEFCFNCTCKDCFNNLDYEDERQRAIKSCLERNPSAFKPKITSARDDMRLHNKGCNCKRSGCLKNYCECYEAKIPCSSNCKCIGCRNIEDRPDLDMDPVNAKLTVNIPTVVRQKRQYEKAQNSRNHEKILSDACKSITLTNNDTMDSNSGSTASGTVSGGSGGTMDGPSPEKQRCNFITQEVVDATMQCMFSQADECMKSGLPLYQSEKLVLEEMGRCLVEIIDFSIRNTDLSITQD